MTDDDAYAAGWVFYKGDGTPEGLPTSADEYADWIQGFAAGVAEYGLDETSIESALARYSFISPVLREGLLVAAEHALETSTEFMRWPSIPVRAD